VDYLTSERRSLIVGANEKVPLTNGEYVTGINLDNAATTPPLKAVLKEVTEFIPWYSSVHRGTGYKSILSSDLYETGREIIKDFVGADKTKDVVIYTKNTTESINMLSYILAQDNDRNTVVLSTRMEHLANDLPWRDIFNTDYVQIDAVGRLVMSDLELKLKQHNGKVKLVTVTGASNVTGYKNPIYQIACLAHKYGAKILVDGAQLVPHAPVDMKEYGCSEHIDYLAFSAHKMYSPFGVGVLIGPKDTLEKYQPVYRGGGAVKLTSSEFVKWDDAPYKYEAGTPNVIGVAALVAAIRTLKDIGMNKVDKSEKALIKYTVQGLSGIPDLKLYCATENFAESIGIAAFDIPGIHHRLLAKILAGEAGIAVRSGLFCAHPYVERLLNITDEDLDYYKDHHEQPLPGLVRISLGLYNTYHEIDILLDAVDWIVRNKKMCMEKYQRHIAKEKSREKRANIYRREVP